MQFNWQDWFIGGTSIAMGLTCWYWALIDAEIGLRLKLAKLVANSFGRGGARVFYVIVGAILVCLGAAIASGYTLELIGQAPSSERTHFLAQAAERAKP